MHSLRTYIRSYGATEQARDRYRQPTPIEIMLEIPAYSYLLQTTMLKLPAVLHSKNATHITMNEIAENNRDINKGSQSDNRAHR